MRDEREKRIGHLYPESIVPSVVQACVTAANVQSSGLFGALGETEKRLAQLSCAAVLKSRHHGV